MSITTGKIFSILDSLESARGARLYRVTDGKGEISRVAAYSLRDCRSRVLEINPDMIILGIEEVPGGSHS